MGTGKYLVHFRNQINQQNANASAAGAAPDVLNINPLQDLPTAMMSSQPVPTSTTHQVQVHHDSDFTTVTGPSASSSSFPPPPDCNFNVNAINLELNELRPKATKMLPKGSTGGSKRGRPIRHREQNNLMANCGAAAASGGSGVDLNLASTVSRQDSK